MTCPASTAATYALHAQDVTDLDLGDHGAISAAVLVLGEPDPSSARAIALFASLPAGRLRCRLDHFAGTRVLQVPEPEFDRIDVGRRGELIHERFDREDVGKRPERAQRRNPKRHIGDEVVADLLRREVVERDRVPVGTARGLRHVLRGRHRKRRIHVPGGEEVDALPPSGPLDVGMTPDFMVPVDDPLRRIERGGSRTTIAEPYGDQASSSSRVHCTRTGRPQARASSAASSATSSAPLWP